MRFPMRLLRTFLVVLLPSLLAACAGGTVDEGAPDHAEASLSGWSSSLIYSFVSAVPPDAQGGPLALRRANAVPGGVQGSTFGYATLPYVSAADAQTQAALDALLAIPYAGHEQSVIALVGFEDDSKAPIQPAV